MFPRINKNDDYLVYFDELLASLDSNQQEVIKNDLMGILKEKIRGYTGGNSSVDKAIGQALMDGCVYTLVIYFQSLPSTSYIALLQEKGIKEIYQQASLFLKQRLHQGQIALNNFLKQAVSLDLIVYQETIFKGLKEFYRHYNFASFPQDTILTFDYPTYNPLGNEVGIKKYLRYFQFICLENQFLACFEEKQLTTMLHHYQPGYQVLIFNVPHLLLQQLLLKTAIQSSFDCLSLNKGEVKQIEKYFQSHDMELVLKNSFNIVVQKLSLKSILVNYLERQLESLVHEIICNYQLNQLTRELSYQIND